ncbi:PhnD/SsuA/transferrin family substrate-binding protein [Hyphomicrobium sp. xq]|uniref:PhnD/SsuA/transferrin family substrate-binding protein n=1 Tax=Hyphomicrobium album TaxID=2665159 RepID=A0A6I3KJ93_9HYPH|nr:PhnD/SsuA/transferrin family substrate-binding protein [Hyphomicrobium album]MTD94403.1 PhnD/SsuA/transferrin family substrate-binding protein [Hyphomicrobium album]
MPDQSGSSRKLTGGFDTNLDFDFADPAWAAFARSAACSITSYTDLDVLTTGLRQQMFDFSYLPSSNCFFLREAPYRGIVSAMTPITKRAAQSSVFVVAKENPATSWHQLRGKRLGYINTYCTTSYFSPSILLAREGFALKDFFDAFPVAAWQGQIDTMLSGGIDATMVYEDVWLAQPSNAERTKVLARLDGLPTPPFIVHSSLDAAVCAELKQTLLGLKPTIEAGTLYAGFADYQDARMQRWFADLAALPGLARAA